LTEYDKIENKIKEIKKGVEVKRYITFAERMRVGNPKIQNNNDGKLPYENSDLGLAMVIDKTNSKVLDYPDVDKSLLLLKSVFKHDIFMMDLLETLFIEQKHVDGKATERANNVIINIAKSLSLNESEKRNPILNFIKRKR